MGPLLDGMVIRLHLLASLVRSTAINVHRWLAPTLALSHRNATLNVSSTSNNKHRSQPRSVRRSSNHGDGGSGGADGDRALRKRSSASADYLKTATDMATMIDSRSQPQSQRASFIQQIVDVHSIDVHSIKHCLSIPFVDGKK
jgi:hypothetical protein